MPKQAFTQLPYDVQLAIVNHLNVAAAHRFRTVARQQRDIGGKSLRARPFAKMLGDAVEGLKQLAKRRTFVEGAQLAGTRLRVTHYSDRFGSVDAKATYTINGTPYDAIVRKGMVYTNRATLYTVTLFRRDPEKCVMEYDSRKWIVARRLPRDVRAQVLSASAVLGIQPVVQ